MQRTTTATLTTAGFIIAFTGAVLFSTKAIMVKLAFAGTGVNALSLLMLRMLCSLPFYIAVLWYSNTRQQQKAPLTAKQWWQLLWLGIFGYYLSSLLDFEGLQYVSAGLERLILFLYPTFVVLINLIFFKQKISGVQKLALGLTYTGIAIAYYAEMQVDFSNRNFLLGSFLIFLCAVTYSLYIVGSGKLIPRIGATRFTTYAMLAATGGIFIHFIFRNNWTVFTGTGNTIWIYGLALAVVATVIPSFMISAALKKIGSNNVAIISSIGPVSTIVQAHFFLGERMHAAQAVGTILVIAGILLIGWKKEQEDAV
ncbi:MAG TPA: DMT family transporter [Ferruginibacter sp.]|nr:DMT family transporter [Ferruginibacter sp.]HMP21381.1 DMT family transporter [Ferruginibacter sp.]